MRRTKESAEKTRLRLIEAATKVFRAKGYAATNLQDIADEAQVTRGAISWHFRNKENIYRALNLQGSVKIKEAFLQILRDYPEPQIRIQKLIQYFVANREEKHCQISILNKLLEERPHEFQDVIEKIESTTQFLITSFKETIEAGISRGIFHTVADPGFMGKAITTFFWGFFTNYPTQYRDYSAEELIRQLTHYFNALLVVDNYQALKPHLE